MAVTAALGIAGAILPASAQQPSPLSAGAHAIVTYDHVEPAPGSGMAGELRVVQPVVMLHAGPYRRRFRLDAMANLEGLSMRGGQLAPGAWGEGYVDRRHPHTWLHELVVTWALPAVSLSAGKGFAPFGTDDPVSRPILRYPVNHHLAQVLERAVVMGAARRGPVMLEGAVFNGDEPENPEHWPNLGRFGDSWSARLTLLPWEGIEAQVSHARVASPEHRDGAGLTQRKWSASVRAVRQIGRAPVYGLVEWARSAEAGGFFRFTSLLGEAAWSPGRYRVAYRFERTERPEEQRTVNLYRSVRPHLDNSIVGTSRWILHSVAWSMETLSPEAPLSIAPLVELTLGNVHSLTPVSFDPEDFYGRDTFWALSVGVRVSGGARLHRMGRYGVAAGSGAQHH